MTPDEFKDADSDAELAAMREVLDALFRIRRVIDALAVEKEPSSAQTRLIGWMTTRIEEDLPEIYEGWEPRDL